MSDVRQRNVQKPDEGAVLQKVPTTVPDPDLAKRVKEEDDAFSLLDIARTCVLLLLVLSAVSWLVTRDSFTFNVPRPNFTRLDVIKTWINGPQGFTDKDLAQYDGTDPTKPIYLAINGTIYDVTAGARHYGPGGSYHFFAGADASRGFVTNCFKEDRTPDMRGVEEMFIPLDNPEVDDLYTPEQLRNLKAEEREKAKQQVYQGLKHWVDFFGNSRKYTKIGMVQRSPGWETKGIPHPLCERAQKGRPKSRKPPQEQVASP